MLIRGIPTSVAGHMDPFIMGDDTMVPCIGPGIEYRFTELTARIIGDLGYTNAQTGVSSSFYRCVPSSPSLNSSDSSDPAF